jgi:hypothetical protein
MSDLEYMIWLTIAVSFFVLIIALLEWFDPKPTEWVVKVRLWINRRKR